MELHLKEFGFTEGEEKTYLALLKVGPSSSGQIAKESGVSRSKSYETLEKLIRKGLVSHFKKNNISYFQAAPPELIKDYLDKKTQIIDIQKENFEKILPQFKKIIEEASFKKEAEVFEGSEGIKTVREMFLKEMKPKETIYYFGNSASGHENMLGYWDDFNKRRIKKKVWSWIIYNADAKKYGKRRKKLKYTKVKYLPNKGNTHAWIEIYRDSVAIVLKYETPMAIVINNKLVAESFRTYFDILWSVSKDK